MPRWVSLPCCALNTKKQSLLLLLPEWCFKWNWNQSNRKRHDHQAAAAFHSCLQSLILLVQWTGRMRSEGRVGQQTRKQNRLKRKISLFDMPEDHSINQDQNASLHCFICCKALGSGNKYKFMDGFMRGLQRPQNKLELKNVATEGQLWRLSYRDWIRHSLLSGWITNWGNWLVAPKITVYWNDFLTTDMEWVFNDSCIFTFLPQSRGPASTSCFNTHYGKYTYFLFSCRVTWENQYDSNLPIQYEEGASSWLS